MKTAGLARGGGGAEAGVFGGAEVPDGGGCGVGAGLLIPEAAGGRCTGSIPVLVLGWSAVTSSGSESSEDSESSSVDDDLWCFRWAPLRLLTFSWAPAADWSDFLLREQRLEAGMLGHLVMGASRQKPFHLYLRTFAPAVPTLRHTSCRLSHSSVCSKSPTRETVTGFSCRCQSLS